MARKPIQARGAATRSDRAGAGGQTGAARANQDGRFGGAAASASRAQRQDREPGSGRTGFASQNTEQRTRDGRAQEPTWQKETQSAEPVGPTEWFSATELVDSPETKRAPKASEKPGPDGPRGTSSDGIARRLPPPGDPAYEAHADPSTRRRDGARGRRDDSARPPRSSRKRS